MDSEPQFNAGDDHMDVRIDPCPKCGTEMELKTKGDPFAAIIGGNVLTIFQCPACKNIEVKE